MDDCGAFNDLYMHWHGRMSSVIFYLYLNFLSQSGTEKHTHFPHYYLARKDKLNTFSFEAKCRVDAETETPVLWPPHAKSWLIGKYPDAGRDWEQEEKGTTEDEMAGWHHRLNAYEFGWTPGAGDGQGGLVCCGSWGRRESDTAERLNWTEQG